MTQSPKKPSIPKITLSSSRDIPFDKLSLSQANVRHVKAGVSIEELAEDIARRSLLHGLCVRAVLDDAGQETGRYEVPAGGRRYRALERLVKQKRLARNAPVPCVVREGGIAEEDSLAENVQRAPLHPLDQFRAFLALRERGQSEEEIAAAFFVTATVVKQRLRLASVSPKLLEIYAQDGLVLEQLMAFTVCPDRARQEQVFEQLATAYDKSAHTIRRMLTEGAIRASDKRARFIGVDAYLEAGGEIANDLFQEDDGGWLQDAGLVNRLAAEKLQREAEPIRAEGWKWIEVSAELAYDRAYGLRQLRGEPAILSEEDEVSRAALQAEYDRIEAEHAADEELPEEADRRLGELESALEAFEARPLAFDPADVAIAGAFVGIGADGALKVERGFVRPQDERPVEPEPEDDSGSFNREEESDRGGDADGRSPADSADGTVAEPEEDEGLRPIPDRVLTELTACRTLALRHAMGERPDVAFLAVLHVLALQAFYTYRSDSCLEFDLRSVALGPHVSGLSDGPLAQAIHAHHESWRTSLPRESSDLWDVLVGWDRDTREALFAHCAAFGINAVHEAWNRRPRAMAHADRLAEALNLDMAANWTPTGDAFLGRVTKARILAAVTEAKGQRSADRIAHMNKGEMVAAAEGLLAGSGWLPEPLRTPGRPGVEPVDQSEPDVVQTAEEGGESAIGEADASAEDAADPHAIAAE